MMLRIKHVINPLPDQTITLTEALRRFTPRKSVHEVTLDGEITKFILEHKLGTYDLISKCYTLNYDTFDIDIVPIDSNHVRCQIHPGLAEGFVLRIVLVG